MQMPVYLRVKRLRSDVPVERFETERLNKVSRLSPDDNSASTFCYIGSQSTESDVTKVDLTELPKVTSQGSFKLLWNASSGKIVGKGVSTVPCVIRVNHLKRPICTETTSSGADPPTSMPAKVMRIIDVTPTDPAGNDLPDSLHSTSLDSNAKSSQPTPEDTVDYVYDLYRLERRHRARPHSRFTSIHRSPSPHARTRTASGASEESDLLSTTPYARDEIVFDTDLSRADSQSDGYRDDDEDDSNSESNWRNDYPDEEEEESTSSSRSSSNSSSDSDSSDRPSKTRLSDYWF